jgi:hypothetical protein
LLLVVVVSVTSADDGTSAPRVRGRLTDEHRSRLRNIWADGKYRNHHLADWLAAAGVGYEVEVIGRPAGGVGLVEQPDDIPSSGRSPGWVGTGGTAGATSGSPSRARGLTDEQTVKLAALLEYNPRTVRAYLLREDFQRAPGVPTPV